MEIGSKEVSSFAIQMAISSNRTEEDKLKIKLRENGVSCAAVNYGGEYLSSIMKIIEKAVVAAKRENVIRELHNEEGAVAGAAREALTQIMQKAAGLNVGGKIGIARYKEHVCVCVYFGIGLLHLNEISIGLGHRVC